MTSELLKVCEKESVKQLAKAANDMLQEDAQELEE